MLMRMRSGVQVHFTSTVPCVRLYLIALVSRLIKTCFSRVRSALTNQVWSNGRKFIGMPRCCACGSIMAWHSRMTSISDTGTRDSDSLPDSITARSRISLIRSSKYHPPWRISLSLAIWVGVGVGEPFIINWAKPRTALSGVRNSWLILEIKFDFARLAFSAEDLECVSSCLLYTSDAADDLLCVDLGGRRIIK